MFTDQLDETNQAIMRDLADIEMKGMPYDVRAKQFASFKWNENTLPVARCATDAC